VENKSIHIYILSNQGKREFTVTERKFDASRTFKTETSTPNTGVL